MTLSCRVYAQYLTSHVPSMREDDFAGLNLVNLIKGRPFKGNYSNIPDGDKLVLINKDSSSLCKEIFCRWVVDVLLSIKSDRSIALVPIPNKSALLTTRDQVFPTAALAQMIVDNFSEGVSLAPILYWRTPLQKASERGPRDPHTLYAALAMTKPPLGVPKTVVLIDDVITSGGHAQACAAKLRSKGFSVKMLIAAAKTFHEQQTKVFSIEPFTLEDYIPPS